MPHTYNPVRARLSSRQAVWLGQLSVGTAPTVVPFQTRRSLMNLRLLDTDGHINEHGRAWLAAHPHGALENDDDRQGSHNATYHALLDAVSDLLESTDWYRLYVRDVTELAGVKISTFHHYFRELPMAVRALLARKVERGQPLTEYEWRLKLLLDWEDMRRADPDGAE